jgi:transcriptional regulator with XRE-family HTH domain
MKLKQKKQARELRKQKGLSIKEIAKRLGVAKSSVSRWVRDIKLTRRQHNKLRKNVRRASDSNIEKWKEIRATHQENGRRKAREKNLLHSIGCMLYWAEGWKRNNVNDVAFSNSDVQMLRLFIKFLRECFGVATERILIAINCYTDVYSKDEIERYWISKLGLNRSCLRKTMINKKSSHSKGKRSKMLEYGTCKIMVHDVRIIQSIYGAIQEYGGFENKEWLG